MMSRNTKILIPILILAILTGILIYFTVFKVKPRGDLDYDKLFETARSSMKPVNLNELNI